MAAVNQRNDRYVFKFIFFIIILIDYMNVADKKNKNNDINVRTGKFGIKY